MDGEIEEDQGEQVPEEEKEKQNNVANRGCARMLSEFSFPGSTCWECYLTRAFSGNMSQEEKLKSDLGESLEVFTPLGER